MSIFLHVAVLVVLYGALAVALLPYLFRAAGFHCASRLAARETRRAESENARADIAAYRAGRRVQPYGSTPRRLAY